jgi:hypothetical protein
VSVRVGHTRTHLWRLTLRECLQQADNVVGLMAKGKCGQRVDDDERPSERGFPCAGEMWGSKAATPRQAIEAQLRRKCKSTANSALGTQSTP